MVEFTRNLQKFNSHYMHKLTQAARQEGSFYASVVMATIASLLDVRLCCIFWAILASLLRANFV